VRDQPTAARSAATPMKKKDRDTSGYSADATTLNVKAKVWMRSCRRNCVHAR
jgi:hypothetical protein